MPLQTSRLHQLTIDTGSLPHTAIHPLAFRWQTHINQPHYAHILAYSTYLLLPDDCQSLIGNSLCLTTLDAQRQPTARTGIIQAIHYQHSNGPLHFYQLDVVSPDWLLTQSCHTRLFAQQSPLDIVTSILTDYDFQWQPTDALLEDERFITPLTLRTQAGVSDWGFITSLLADIGINTLWVSDENIDKLGAWQLLTPHDHLGDTCYYSYAQASVQSGQDTISQLQPISKQLGSQQVIVRSDGLEADVVYEGSAFDDSALTIDDTTYLIAAPSRVDSDDAAAAVAKQWVAANQTCREYYLASGSMRGLHVANPVAISHLPNIRSLSTSCIASTLIGIEPASDSVSYHNQQLIQTWLMRQGVSHHQCQLAGQSGVWVEAKLIADSFPYTRYPSPSSFVSHTYSGITQARSGQSTSPNYDSQISEDGLHKVITTPVWAGISDHDDQHTPPLRSLQLSSGASHGWQFTPRLGQAVLLSHWYGDVDSPVITRSLYDGIGMGDVDERDVTYQDGGKAHRYNLMNGSSPRWHGAGLGHSQISEDDAHSGFISGISQFGLDDTSESNLLFDDTPNNIGVQWSVNTGGRANAKHPTITDKAVFAPSEHVIELGVLRHRFGNHQSSIRGAGFEIASDKGLQVSGDSGVLLSTFGIRHSQSTHESAWVNDAGARQLGFGFELSDVFSEAKQGHLQSKQQVDAQIKAFKETAQVMDDTLNAEMLGASDVMSVSRDSLLASSGNTLWAAKQIVRQSALTQSDMVAGHYKLHADSIYSLAGAGGNAAKSGLHISANTKPLAIQAQGGELQLHSQKGLTIGSESGQVNVTSPTRIKLQTSGGASVTIDDSGVKLVCPGTIKIKAVKKGLVGGARANYSVPMMPETIPLFSNKLDVYDFFINSEFCNVSYVAMMEDGQVMEGILDEHGRTDRIISMQPKKFDLLVGLFDKSNWITNIIYHDSTPETKSIEPQRKPHPDPHYIGEDDALSLASKLEDE